MPLRAHGRAQVSRRRDVVNGRRAGGEVLFGPGRWANVRVRLVYRGNQGYQLNRCWALGQSTRLGYDIFTALRLVDREAKTWPLSATATRTYRLGYLRVSQRTVDSAD